MRRAWLVLAVVGCGSPQPRALPQFRVPFATGPGSGSGSGGSGAAAMATADGDDDGRFELPPGCTAADRDARIQELAAIADETNGSAADPRAILGELRAELAKPCLDYIAPAMAIPKAATREHLHDAFWRLGLDDALDEAAGGFRVAGDRRAIVLPPEITPDLDGSAAAAIAPMLCAGSAGSAGSDASCARSGSYIARAEKSFDRRYDADRKDVLPVEACQAGARPIDDDLVWPHTLEEFASCAGAEAAHDLRFATTDLRAPERGWLILRGRRGHYDWADEARAYDLATGAAYVVRHTGQIIVDNGQPHGDESFTGRLAPDEVRELAFVLLARAAIVPVRTWRTHAVVPPKIPIGVSPPGTPPPDPGAWSHVTWASDAQTEIAWTFVDGATRVAGTFTWPDAADWIDDYIDELLAVAEAGLVRACAPAKLPAASVLAGPAGAVSRIDASRAEQDATDRALAGQLEALRGGACRGAR